ncbi:t-SNARE coiled-coil homology domain profile [Nakaseomyces glabratus]
MASKGYARMRVRYRVHVDEVQVRGGVAKYGLVVSVWDQDGQEELRETTVWRRYSEFLALKKELESSCGCDIPYEFPPRTLWFGGGAKTGGTDKKVIEERKVKLADFMSELLNDSFDVKWKRHKSVSNFLGMDIAQMENVKSTKSKPPQNGWMDMFHEYKMEFEDCKKQEGVQRSRNAMYIRLKLSELEQILNTEELPEEERDRRSKLLTTLKQDLNELTISREDPIVPREQVVKPLPGRRMLGETTETAKYNNRDLLQVQKQMNKEQDQELEQLHKIIQRQKQLSMEMNEELSQQNELLDSFQNDVDRTAMKLKQANRRARDFNDK